MIFMRAIVTTFLMGLSAARRKFVDFFTPSYIFCQIGSAHGSAIHMNICGPGTTRPKTQALRQPSGGDRLHRRKIWISTARPSSTVNRVSH